VGKLGIEFLNTVVTDAMGELGFRMLLEVQLERLPVPLVVTYLLAAGADGKKATE
jgi:hypothetical protein